MAARIREKQDLGLLKNAGFAGFCHVFQRHRAFRSMRYALKVIKRVHGCTFMYTVCEFMHGYLFQTSMVDSTSLLDLHPQTQKGNDNCNRGVL